MLRYILENVKHCQYWYDDTEENTGLHNRFGDISAINF